jgi:serine/threonine protein phosphatase PrpC
MARKKQETIELLPAEIRASEDDLPTQPLGKNGPDTVPLNPPEYSPLPPGALLHERRYEILSVVSPGPKINVYRAEENVEQRVCPKCGENRNSWTDHYCSSCGVQLEDVIGTRPVYLIKESPSDQTFQAESQIARLGLKHPHIIALHDAFSYIPYGRTPRGYLVMEQVDMSPLAHLPVPQEEHKVLTWAIQLAQALDYLHQNHVVHSRVKADNIFVDDGSARLTNFNVASIIPKAGWQTIAPQRYAEDIHSLVQTLYYLLTGQEKLGAASVSPAWARIFNRVAGPPEQSYQTAAELVADLQAMAEERQRPASAALWVGCTSHVGQVRELNEDSLLTLELNQVYQSVNRPVGLYIVTDGMGGHQGGEVASAMATQIVATRLLNAVVAPALGQESLPPESIETILKDAILEANLQIRNRGRSMGNDMGTTIVMAIIVGDTAYIANVGDSRAYLLDGTGIRQISVDHSLIQRLLDTGQITPDEAKVHPQRSAIYRVLGDKPRVEVDTFVHRFKRGERLLLCSDGLNGMIGNDVIHQLVVTSPDPQTACSALVEAANAAGGGDNVTVILMQAEAM